MRAHKSIRKIILASNMRPINVTLDATTWELAKKKTNFSSWVRDQLRSEDNKRKVSDQRIVLWCRQCGSRRRKKGESYCQSCQVDMGLLELGYIPLRGEEE